MKGLYCYIICDCSPSGIWIKDLVIASEYIGFKITEQEFSESFLKTNKAIDLLNGKIFFPGFLEHQYPAGLQSGNPAHKNIILELKKYSLLSDDLQLLKRPNEGALEGLQSSLSNSNSNSNSLSKGNKGGMGGKEKPVKIPTFEEFKNYACENKPGINLQNLELKYKAWKEAGWSNGKGIKIKNWKSALLNTLPYIDVNKSEPTSQPRREQTQEEKEAYQKEVMMHIQRIRGNG